MSVFVVVELQVMPGKVDAVTDYLRRVLPDTRAFEGFESLVLQQNHEEPTSLLMYEQWASRQHFDAYVAWRTETGALTELVDMLSGPPSFRFFDLVEV